MKSVLLRLIIVALVAVSFGFGAAAQVPPAELPIGSQPLTATVPFVTQGRHRHAPLLIAPDDLSISDNGKPPQSILAVRTAGELPLRIGIVIDTSNSERSSPLYGPGLRATFDFINQVLTGPEDRVFLETFDTVPSASGFMNKNEAMNFKLNLNPGGASALFDAIYFACNDRMKADPIQPARRVLVILGDGGDNFSLAKGDKALAAAQLNGTVVFFVSTSVDHFLESDGERMKRFADRTGGLAFLRLKPMDLTDVLAIIREQIENMYAVTFVPSDLDQPGKYRSIELKAKSDKKLKLRTPQGYYLHAGPK